MSLVKSKQKSVSVPEQLKRKRDKEDLRGQKIRNDLRLLYGYGPPLCLLILVFVVIGLLILHFCGVISLSVVVVGLVSAAITACAKLVAAIAKEVLNNN